MTTPADILEYWFGPEGSEPAANADLWWGNVEDQNAVDAEIEQRFGDLVDRALDGELQEWQDDPDSLLAYVLLLDQFPRHIYRGRPKAFAGAEYTVPAVHDAVDRGVDTDLDVPGRIFLYMPLMHAEDRQVQERSVALYERLVEDAPEETQPMAEGSLQHAREHAEIVERFGRYPHRNPILGRESTDEERDFLDQMDHSYGQSAESSE